MAANGWQQQLSVFSLPTGFSFRPARVLIVVVLP